MPPPWRSALSSSAPTASRMRAGVTRASSPSGSRTLRARPAARRRRPPLLDDGRQALAQVRRARRPAARAARAASSRSSSTAESRSACSSAAIGLPHDVRIGVRGQLVEPQLQRGEPAAQLVGDVADQLALALDELGERGGGRVEHVGDAVELGDAVPARGGAEVARAEPGRAVGDAATAARPAAGR